MDLNVISDLNQKGSRIYSKLNEMGIIHEEEMPPPSPEDGRITFGSGYPSKAIEKFIGYYDRNSRIAYTPSMSILTDFSIARAYCLYNKAGKSDIVYLDSRFDPERSESAKIALDKFRSICGVKGYFTFYVERERRYVRAKGLSESSAVAAAVSSALVSNVFGYNVRAHSMLASRFAKFVSGSGTRSVFPGLSTWISYPGIQEPKCMAHEIKIDFSKIKIAMFPKYADYSTNQMHELSVKSPQYIPWVQNKFARFREIIDRSFDLEDLLIRAEEEMLNLNSLLMSAGRVLQTEESLSLIERIVSFRKKNPGLYFTADTGPSILVMTLDENLLKEFLETETDFYISGNIVKDSSPSASNAFRERGKAFFASFTESQ